MSQYDPDRPLDDRGRDSTPTSRPSFQPPERPAFPPPVPGPRPTPAPVDAGRPQLDLGPTAAELAAQREAAMGGGVTANPWESGSVNLDETTELAREFEAAEPMALLGHDGGGMSTRKELVEVDDQGIPVVPDSRPVDMVTADEYGDLSRHAIAVINKYFASPDCSELHFNAPDAVFAKVRGERVRVAATFNDEEEYNHFIEDLIRQANTFKTWEQIKRRGRDVVQMSGGDRMAIFMPPYTDTIKVAIHKVVARTWDMTQLLKNGTLNAPMANFLKSAVRGRSNILICGELGSGKSVFLSLLAQEFADNERIALIEEVPEVFLDKPDVNRITYYPDSMSEQPMGLPEVLDTSLYMRFDRIVIGELHDRGTYRMLRVMSLGGDGSMCTFHAGSAEQAIDQIRNHVILEHGQIPAYVAANFIRTALNIIIVLQRIDGVHRVKEIVEVEWRNLSDKAEAVGRNVLFRWNGQTGDWDSPGRLDEHGKILEKANRYGVKMNPDWFRGDDFGGTFGQARR